MKQISFQDTLFYEDVTQNKAYGAIIGGEKYICVKEASRFAFHNPMSQAVTKTELTLTELLFSFKESDIFAFDSLAEMADWLNP